jgi:predicted RNase H-like HicB family nuclease
MTNYHFSVVLEPDREEPERYNVRVPALPGCLTYGESIEDALANAREAIEVYVESLIEDGEPVPAEVHPTIAATIVISLDRAA